MRAVVARMTGAAVLLRHYYHLFGPRGVALLGTRTGRRFLPDRAPSPGRRRRNRPAASRRNRPRRAGIAPYLRAPDRAWFAGRFPTALASRVVVAEQIRRHELDLLGTGPVWWGDPIDWHQDVRSGYRWPLRPYRTSDAIAAAPAGADVKIPWELSRCHHLVALAQAWWLTGEAAYVTECAAQWESWLAANPWALGVNWASAMDVAIRALNLLWMRGLVASSPAWTSSRDDAMLASLRDHGRFIEANLEVGVREGRLVVGNHYLANLCGLACLGLCCPEAPEAARWRRAGLSGLAEEMRRQVLPDGFYFEGSTGYHALAVELFLVPALLARQAGTDVPSEFWSRLEQMLEAMMHLLRPDGSLPQIGDGDDGHLLVLAGYPRACLQARPLLAIGAVLFDRPDLKAAALVGEPSASAAVCGEDVFWLLGRDGVGTFDRLHGISGLAPGHAFLHGGLFVMRSDDQDYCLLRTATSTELGPGTGPRPHPSASLPSGHLHNDTLSVELWIDGRAVFVDPGTGCYTADPAARNWFRSTAAHNTAMVDGEEINRIPEDDLFRLHRDARVRVLEWQADGANAGVAAEHDGYARLASPVSHRRRVRYAAATATWNILDELSGAGVHTATVRWHGYPGDEFAVTPQPAGLQVATPSAHLRIAIDESMGWRYGLEPSRSAPGYGQLVTTECLWVSVQFRDRCRVVWSVRAGTKRAAERSA